MFQESKKARREGLNAVFEQGKASPIQPDMP